MQIQVLLFAQARERAGRARMTLELPNGGRVSDALAALERMVPDLAELRPHLAVAVDQKLVGPDAVIRDGAEVALLPPVSGGAPARRGAASRAETSLRTGARFTVSPATPERWTDLERLFGERGACAGCWCQWPRVRGKAFKEGAGAGNKRRLRGLVADGPPPGLLGYLGDEPVAWVAIAPRAAYERLAHSRTLAPVDDEPVWSVPCFFVAKPYRGRGLTVRMLQEATRFARHNGARILEGYPMDPGKRTADAFVWWGLTSAFAAVGFREVARRSQGHPIVRKTVGAASTRPRRTG
jgi:molybdopterin converting factor subunit 1